MAQIIGLIGQKGSGKSTVASMISSLVPDLLVYQPSLADPIKKGAQAMFNVPHEHLYGPSDLRESAIPGMKDKRGRPLTVRFVLQTIGTEWGRRIIGENIWIDTLIQHARTLPHDALVIVPDVRFLNEARALHLSGHTLWRISRRRRTEVEAFCDAFPFIYRVGDVLKRVWKSCPVPHASEREMWVRKMDRYVDREINNTDTIEKLQTRIEMGLESLGLLKA